MRSSIGQGHQPAHIILRLWMYQRERFPLLAHGSLIAVFSVGLLTCAALLRGQTHLPMVSSLLASFASALIFFLQLRIADECKDYADDLRYRPYRPVPRGLVSLRELGAIAAGGAAVQLVLVLALAPVLLPLLLALWGYLALMSVEFFAPAWLKARPLLYVLSHMLILPLLALYVTAWDWGVAGVAPPEGIGALLLLSFANGLVIEIGRKLRAPADEEPGVETYSARWGMREAVGAWLGALALAAASALLLAARLDVWTGMVLLVGGLLAGALVVAWHFLDAPRRAYARWIEGLSALATLLLYAGVGLLPLL